MSGLDSGTEHDPGEPVLAIGKERVNIRAITTKVSNDIKFLQDRIAKMKAFNTPNPETLKVYEDMLDSRKAVLQWLESNYDCTNESGKKLSKSA